MGSTIAEASARVGRTPEEVSRALASYVRSILSGDSRFDRFVKGDRTALSDGEQRGLTLFRGKGNCTACRVGRTRATSARTTGVAWRGGTFAHEGDGRGAFKTPTLREIARTVPYMHDGSLASLEEVVEFYDRGGQPQPASRRGNPTPSAHAWCKGGACRIPADAVGRCARRRAVASPFTGSPALLLNGSASPQAAAAAR